MTDLAEKIKEESGGNLFKQTQDYEISLIKAALVQSNGNITKAAQILKVNRTTLTEKCKKYGLKEKKWA